MTRSGVRALAALALLAALLVLLLAPAGPAHAAPGTSGTAEQQAIAELAQRYAPRVVVREQAEGPCGEGEAYQPMDVDAVLGRPDVRLVLPDGSVVDAPTSADLAAAPPQASLDLPGDPLNPGCDYAQWFAPIKAASPPTLYAHLATDPNHPGQVALQYWFFWPFNDWNNKHEGDWEMLQIVFPAATAQEALTVTPTSVAFAQHEGSETSPWDSAKLVKDGTHLVVYPSQGSHAAYFNQAQWFGKSAAAGFGCDTTEVGAGITAVELRPDIVVVPADPSSSDPQFGWLTYQGRWGQQAPSVNNGPTGPITKEQWTGPITWQDEQGRPDAVALPPIPGPALTMFCTLTERGSLLFLGLLDRPWLTLGVVLAVVAALVLAVRATRWRGGGRVPLDRERRAGQLFVSSFGVWWQRLGAFAVIGALLIAARFLASVAYRAALAPQDTGSITDTAGRTTGFGDLAASLVGLLVLYPAIAYVLSASVAAVAREEPRVGIGEALRRGIVPLGTFGAFMVVLLLVAVLVGSVLLLPVAALVLALLAAAGPAAMVEGRGPLSALRRSMTLSKGRRWRTAGISLFILVAAFSAGGLVGAVLLLLTTWSFFTINTIGAVIAAVLVPIAGIALTLQFYDLRRRYEREHLGEAVSVVA
jgi:hypothetical protein